MMYTHKLTRRVAVAFVFATALVSASPIHANSYPDKPVTLIVPYPAGGSMDFVARALQPHLQEVFGQPVVIDNRGGASGMIGS